MDLIDEIRNKMNIVRGSVHEDKFNYYVDHINNFEIDDWTDVMLDCAEGELTEFDIDDLTYNIHYYYDLRVNGYSLEFDYYD